MHLKKILKSYPVEIGVIISSLIFSFWLMWKIFYVSHGSIFIAGKLWSDFGNHIPLIRSFSFGNNLPAEFPLFSGEPIRYHFIFYLLVGWLEKMGWRLDY